jgi:hypothetical protein
MPPRSLRLGPTARPSLSEPHTAEWRGERFRRVGYGPRSVGRSLWERWGCRGLVATVSLRFMGGGDLWVTAGA